MLHLQMDRLLVSHQLEHGYEHHCYEVKTGCSTRKPEPDGTQRYLRRFFHHIAQLTVSVSLPVPGMNVPSMKRISSPIGVHASPVNSSGNILIPCFFLTDNLFSQDPAKHLHLHNILQIRCSIHNFFGNNPCGLCKLFFEPPDSRFPGIFLYYYCQCLIFNDQFFSIKAVFFQGLWQQVILCDGKFLIFVYPEISICSIRSRRGPGIVARVLEVAMNKTSDNRRVLRDNGPRILLFCSGYRTSNRALAGSLWLE